MTEQNPPAAEDQPGEAQHERLPATDRPRVWIGSLSDYNDGVIHGDWMPADVSEAELYAQIEAMLARSQEPPAEEWMIFDSDNFGAYRVGEYADLETVTRVARGIAEHGLAFAALADLRDADSDALDQFDDLFLGSYDSRQAWAQSIADDFDLDRMIEQQLQLPEWMRSHIRIDLDGIARDLELSAEVTVVDNPEGGIWVFQA